jgi:carboxypeptidase C (cathepsin A)
MAARWLSLVACLAFSAAHGFAQQQPTQRPVSRPPETQPSEQAVSPAEPNRDEPGAHTSNRREVATAAEEKVSSTTHSVRIDRHEIKYTATVSTLPIRLDDGSLGARMFFVAYTRDGQDAKTRPLAFLYNGGPGSASVWLHMGSFGPRRVQMADDGFQPPPPFQLADNEGSILDVCDLVFVDAIDTGYSRAVSGVNSSQFHGAEGDIRAFGEFINTYLSTFNRWPSPKFLIGESYGTIRSAGLAGELQERHGIELTGIVLVSSLLTYQTLSPAPDNDVAYADEIQTFAAIAWYHQKLSPELQQKSVAAVVNEARSVAWGEYLQALARGNGLSDADRNVMAQTLARYTGLSPTFILEANLRVDAARYRKELLRSERLTIGRYDGRFTGVDRDAAGEHPEFDPSSAALQGAYTALFQDYIRNELKWDTTLHYPTLANVRPWTYPQNRYMDETDTLRETMAKNPYLRVFVACGYYDMATFLGGAEFNFSHLAYDAAITRRVSFGYYEAGHMIYIRPSAHKALKEDVTKFIVASPR